MRPKRVRQPGPVEPRFWAKVDKSAECWNWTAAAWSRSVDGRGYGVFRLKINGVWARMLAHRYSYELHNGPIPAGLHVLHSCDNSRCVNPAHLHAGTQTENMLEMHQRNRHPKPWRKPGKVYT